MSDLATSFERWFLARGKTRQGPFSREELRRLALNGELQRTDMVLREGTPRWSPAGDIDGLFDPQPSTVAFNGRVSASETPLPVAIPVTTSGTLHIPGYEILGTLGRGGMGVVYRARQSALKRIVALKLIRAGATAGSEEIDRFRAEAEAAARLQHPNIVQVYEIGEHDGLPYFALEFIEGDNLARRLNGTPLPPRSAAEVVETLARAMQVAHDRGIVHRDLKPANVLIPTDTLSPKITDFGLAKQLDAHEGATVTGQVLGTPSYMAPEQAAGKGKEVGPAADVYALGAILYECLTGRPPFRAASALETLEQVRTQLPVPPRRLLPSVPVDLETIALKCLEKEPSRRYASAVALADELQRFLDGRPILARPVSLPERARRWCVRNPIVAALLMLLVVATAVASGFAVQMFRYAGQAESDAAAARASAETADRKTDEAKKSELVARRLFYGTQMALAVQAQERRDVVAVQEALQTLVPGPEQEDIRGPEWHLMWKWAHGYRLTLGGPKAPVASAVLLPDGKSVLTGGLGNLRVWDAENGQETSLVASDPAMTYETRVVGKDRVIVLGRTDTVQTWWQYTDGRLEQLFQTKLKLGGQSLSAIELIWDVSSDLNTLAAITGDSWMPQTLQVFDRATSRERFPAKQGWSRHLAIHPDGKSLAVVAMKDNAFHRVVLLDTQTGGEKGELPLPQVQASQSVGNHGSGLGTLAYFAEGSRLALKAHSANVHVWNLETRTEIVSPKRIVAERMAFSPNGKYAATVYHSGPQPVHLWETATGKERAVWYGHRGQVLQLAFSPDGRTVVTASSDGTARLWNAGALLEETTDAMKPKLNTAVRALAFAPDNRTLFSAGGDHRICRWDAVERTQRGELIGHKGEVRALAVSPDGGKLASASLDRTVRIWDLKRSVCLRVLEQSAVAQAVAWSPDGNTLALGTFDGARLHHVEADRTEALPDEEASAFSVAFSQDGRTLAVGGMETIRLWEVATRKPGAILKGHTRRVGCLVFTPEGRLVSGSDDQRMRVWDVDQAKEVELSEQSRNSITPRPGNAYYGSYHAFSLSADGKRLAGSRNSGNHGEVLLWELTPGGPVQRGFAPVQNLGLAAAVSSDGRRLAAGHESGAVALWDLAEKLSGATLPQPSLWLPGHTVASPSMAISPDGRRVAEARADFTVRLLDVVTGREVGSLTGHAGPVSRVVFSADGRRIATSSFDRTARVWDVATHREIAVCSGHLHAVRCVALSPDGSRLASGDGSRVDGNGVIHLYEADTGRLIRKLQPNRWTVMALAFSPDGRILASGTGCDYDIAHGRVSLWNPDSGELLGDLGQAPSTYTIVQHFSEGHYRNVAALTFSPDGRGLLTGGEQDGTVRLWDVATRKMLANFDAHTYGVRRLAFTSDGRQAISAGRDGRLRWWDLERREPRGQVALPKGTQFGPFLAPDGRSLLLADGYHRPERILMPTADDLREYEQRVAERRSEETPQTVADYQQAQVLLGLARVHHQRGEESTARAAFDRAQELLQRLSAGTGAVAERARRDLEPPPEGLDLFTILVAVGSRDGRRLHDHAAAFVSSRPADALPFLHEAVRLVPEEPQHHYHLAIALVRLGRIDESLAANEEAVRREPEEGTFYTNLGYCLEKLGRKEEAIATYRKALALSGTDAAAAHNLGNHLSDQGKLDEALVAYRKAIRMKPDYANAHLRLGNVLAELGRPAEALAACREALRIRPDWAEAYDSLSRVYIMQRNWAEAATAAEQAIRLQPDLTLAHFRLGWALLYLKRSDEAAIAALKVLRQSPDWADAHYLLGVVRETQGKLVEAEHSYRRATELAPKNATYHTALGMCTLKYNSTYANLDSLRRAVQLDRVSVSVVENLANALDKTSFGRLHPAEGLEVRQELVRRAPTANNYNDLGNAFHKLNRIEDAIKTYREALRLDPNLDAAHANLGLCLALQERLDESLAASREAIRLAPTEPHAHRNLGRALHQAGRIDEAIAALREANRLDPKHEYSRQLLAEIHERREQWDEALPLWQELRKLAPESLAYRLSLTHTYVRLEKWEEAVAVLGDPKQEKYRPDVIREEHAVLTYLRGRPESEWLALLELPEATKAHGILVDRLADKGWIDEAVTLAQELVRKHPKSSEHMLRLGRVLARKKKWDEAAAAFNDAARIAPKEETAYLELAWVEFQQGKMDVSATVNRSGTKFLPVAALLRLADYLLERERSSDALTAVREVVRREPANAEAQSVLARCFVARKRYDEAAAAAEEAIRLQPDRIAAHEQLEAAYLGQSRIAEAIKVRQELARREPNRAAHPARLAGLYLQLNQWEQAAAHWGRAAELDPNDVNSLLEQAESLKHLGRYDAAVRIFREALKRRPDLVEAYSGLAVTYSYQGNYREKLAVARELVRREPDTSVYHTWLGESLVHTRQWADGLTHLLEGKKRDPELFYRKGLLAAAYWLTGNRSEALKAIQEEYGPDASEAFLHSQLAEELQSLGELEHARSAYTEAVRLEPKSVAYRYELASCLSDLEQIDAAIDVCRDVLKLQADHADAHHLLAILYFQSGKLDQAETEFRAALDANPDFATAYGNLGLVLTERGSLEEAQRVLELAARMTPNAPRPQANLAWFHADRPDLARRDLKLALKYAEKALELNDFSSEAWFAMGLVRYRSGEFAAARTALDKCLTLRPSPASRSEIRFFLAMTLAKLGNREAGRQQFDEADAWMKRSRNVEPQLLRYRAEAAAALTAGG